MRALATSPKLLLLDEPAAGMNPSETAELTETIRRIRDEFNIAVLLIEMCIRDRFSPLFSAWLFNTFLQLRLQEI